MGMNYFAVEKESKEEIHLGKRCAAGFFCWKCGMSNVNYSRTNLSAYKCEPHILYGNDAIHYSDIKQIDIDVNDEPEHINRCPICNEPFSNSDKINSVYAELGLCVQPDKTKQTTCSFTFATTPYKLNIILHEDSNKYDFFNEIKHIEKEELIDIIQNCGVKIFSMVGQDFR